MISITILHHEAFDRLPRENLCYRMIRNYYLVILWQILNSDNHVRCSNDCQNKSLYNYITMIIVIVVLDRFSKFEIDE